MCEENNKRCSRNIIVYTDGANKSRSVPRNAGAGAVILTPDRLRYEVGTCWDDATNNQAELYAIRLGLSFCDYHFSVQSIALWTDSQYCCGVLTPTRGGWKNHAWKNWRLVGEVRELVIATKATVNWLRGHAGYEYNERADWIAQYCKDNQKGWYNEVIDVAG